MICGDLGSDRLLEHKGYFLKTKGNFEVVQVFFWPFK